MNVVFFTVTCAADYDYLLGSIWHHARLGRHLVLDTSPTTTLFRNLPPSVHWVHEPFYGHGWKEFQFRSALERAMNLALEMGPEILVCLDSDDFYTADSGDRLFPLAREAMLETPYIHWCKDGAPRLFGPSEWHPRIWPAWADVRIIENEAWKIHPNYNGNSEHHAIVAGPPTLPVLRVPGLFRNHVHYLVGDKDDEVARQTVDGWPDRGHLVPRPDLPYLVELWYKKGIRPSEGFR